MKVLATQQFNLKLRDYSDTDFQKKLLDFINILEKTKTLTDIKNQFEFSSDNIYVHKIDDFRIFFSIDEANDTEAILLVDLIKKPESAPIEIIKYSRPKLLTVDVNSLINNPEISALEKIKIELELEKIALERDKMIVNSLTEDFKARWQELLNFENENSRWQTLYVTALILVISWVLSNSGETGKYKNIEAVFSGENPYLLLPLALINAIYTLAMAYKGYQIQEIAQYLFKHIGSNISDKISVEFNSWERWRRNETGTPVFIRSFYYFIIGILPTVVSLTILILFFHYRYNNSTTGLKNFFYFVVVFVFVSLLAALSTTGMNSKWNEILAQKISYKKDENLDAGG
jgi:mRNA-degrading endonuclease RelE of RelBE toxin-antitoxin system